MVVRRKRNRHPTGDARLQDTDGVRITLENGEKVDFDLATELRIPDDLDDLRAAARKAPAQLAFWSYQAERALDKVRRQETETLKCEGIDYLAARRYYQDEVGIEPTHRIVQSNLDSGCPKTRRARIALADARKQYGLVRAVRDAVDHRVSMIRALVLKYEQ